MLRQLSDPCVASSWSVALAQSMPKFGVQLTGSERYAVVGYQNKTLPLHPRYLFHRPRHHQGVAGPTLV